MYHRHYTTYLQKELDFLKMLVSRFHEQEKVNGLELDVALQKMQDVYEQLLRIKLMPEQMEDSPWADIPSPVVVSPPEKTIAAKEKKKVSEKPPAPAPAPPPTPTPAPTPVRDEKKQQPEPPKAAILAEKISPSDFHPINETLVQQKTGADLSSKWQSAPLHSIASGIGLNDKFLYIRELFNSDNTLYDNTIQNLDAVHSPDEAMDYIHNHFDWDEKNETVQKFVSLIYRRHGNQHAK